MSGLIHKATGAFLAQEATEIARIQGLPPVVVTLDNQSEVDLVVSAHTIDQAGTEGRAILSTTATQRTTENTGYSGDTATLAFSGQTLNNLPVIPRSVSILPTAGGDTVDATDRDGDGNLYTSDVDEDLCGTIDYFTGAVTLDYPAGKAPNNGQISATYKSESAVCNQKGRKSFMFTSLAPGDTLVIEGACASVDSASVPAASALVHTEVFVAG